jgi:hypothetical protein
VRKKYAVTFPSVFVFGLVSVGPGEAIGHGGKTHADEPFSALQAVQKATALYERLVISGKLPESWETDLRTIQVTIRGTGNRREYVVQFKRTSGDPQHVYFFFDRQGEYAGSNFTGT